MSISSMLSTSTSGMNAQTNQLNATADNIANATTTGYKRSGIEFSSFTPQQSTTQYVSGSVVSDVRHFISEQGNLTSTTAVSDLAIKGNGFFLVKAVNAAADATVSPVFTRAGAFVKNDDGYLVNAANYVLMGYPVTNNVVGTTLEPITISSGLRAAPTENAQFYANLPDSAAIGGTAGPSTLNIFNAAGGTVQLAFDWTKTAAATWDLTVTLPDATTAGPFTLTFETGAPPAVYGQLLSVAPADPTAPLSIDIDLSTQVPPGANPLVVDLQNCTQLDSSYTVLQAQALDGNAASALDHVEVESNGDVFAIYQNGSRSASPSYQVALGFVTAPDRLDVLPGDIYTPSADSGPLQIGTAGTAGLGVIARNSLEQSTVDLATELTNMIVAQRAFETNSKVFETGSTLLQVVVNLVQ